MRLQVEKNGTLDIPKRKVFARLFYEPPTILFRCWYENGGEDR